MEPLELKSIALLQALNDEAKYNQLPLAYQNICKRIKVYFNKICLTKSDIYKLNCLGTPRWFTDLRDYLEVLKYIGKWDSIDEDIYEWCNDSLSKIPDVSSSKCIVCDQYYARKYDAENLMCACDIPSSDDSDVDSDDSIKYCKFCDDFRHATKNHFKV